MKRNRYGYNKFKIIKYYKQLYIIRLEKLDEIHFQNDINAKSTMTRDKETLNTPLTTKKKSGNLPPPKAPG